jgi:hypothetical protein
MIAEIGIAQLTDILDGCFKSTGKNPQEYNAGKSAALAVFLLDMDAAHGKPDDEAKELQRIAKENFKLAIDAVHAK